MKNVSIIRDRGQITIPDAIRKVVSWANPMSAVTITVTRPDEIVIKPHQVAVDWDDIWQKIRSSRSISGSGSQSALQTLLSDRNSH